MGDIYDILRDELGLTDEQIDQLIALGELPTEQEIQQERLERAQALQETPTPQGRYLGGGRIYTAAHPLEHIAGALRQGVGSWQARKTERERRRMAEIESQRFADLLRTMRRPPAPPPNPLGPAVTRPLAPQPMVPPSRWTPVNIPATNYPLR